MTATTMNTRSTNTKIPFRQIRAHFDEETITVYQAYNSRIADAAVKAQKLNASPLFQNTRMTWIKPSWCWVNYRAGYTYKDKNQERILAIKVSHEGFLELLKTADVNHATANAEPLRKTRGKRTTSVMVQWDPERSPRLGKLEHRSIQIGIPVGLVEKWIDEWIVSIEDVTDKARLLKKTLKEDKTIERHELVNRGLVPDEQPYELPEDLREQLRMNDHKD